MRICQNCGAELSDTARFCRKCGTPQEQTRAGESAETGLMEESGAAEAHSTGGAGRPAEGGTTEYQGEDYQWGPPTGGPDGYGQPAMPPVYMGGAQEEEKEEKSSGESTYTYRIEPPTWDHTDEFDAKDISDNKVTAMAAYLLGPLGVIIALLAGQSSPYAAFHMRQGLKFVVADALIGIITLVLCWTLIVPIAAVIFELILLVVRIISFISVCKGRAIEPPIIRSLGFMK